MSDTDWTDYESGPFCRHWGDPSDCDILCENCLHRCGSHEMDEGRTDCHECDCEKWEGSEL